MRKNLFASLFASAIFATTAYGAIAAPQVTRSSQRAATIQMGMTYRQVFVVMNRFPDTVRRESDLLTYEWKNDTAFCQPISVQFRANRVTGLNEGLSCGSYASSMNKPAGTSCKNNKLCKP